LREDGRGRGEYDYDYDYERREIKYWTNVYYCSNVQLTLRALPIGLPAKENLKFL
jgi:hypothetical protein